MNDEQKMLHGLIYDPSEPTLIGKRQKAHRLCRDYNLTLETQEEKRKAILSELLGVEEDLPYLQGPIQFDYGCNTHFGKGCYANFNLTILDCAPIQIGDNVFMGPNVSIVNPVHPLLPEDRAMYFDEEKGYLTDREYAKPIVIGSNCWIASGVIICGGVTIGEGSVIGAGSVVTRDIPPHSLAAGNPCRVIRPLTEKDALANRPELLS